MSIQIHVASFAHEYTSGRKIVEAQGDTVGGCLDNLVAQFPVIGEVLFDGEGRLRDYLQVYVNGELAYPLDLSLPVRDGGQIHILRMIAGG